MSVVSSLVSGLAVAMDKSRLVLSVTWTEGGETRASSGGGHTGSYSWSLKQTMIYLVTLSRRAS